MPITELVFPTYKPNLGRAPLIGARAALAKHLNSITGLLAAQAGHILRHNGKDVENEYRGIANIGIAF